MKITLPAGSVEDLGAGVVRVTLPGASLSDATPLPASGAGSAGAGVAASRDTHAHPFEPAAHVVPETATPQQIAEALIAAGLMEAS